MKTEELIQAYYRAWLESDRAAARALLADDLKFRSPEADFDTADEFFDACWEYSKEFTEMTVEHAVYDSHSAYIVYSFNDICCGELHKVKHGKIRESYVTFNPTR